MNGQGFELSIYSSPNKKPVEPYQVLHAQQFSDWGVKFLKYDYCPTKNIEQANAAELILERIRKLHYAIEAADNTIIYAICEKGWYSGQAKYAENYRQQIKVNHENRKELFEWAPEL